MNEAKESLDSLPREAHGDDIAMMMRMTNAVPNQMVVQSSDETRLVIEKLNIFYGDTRVVHNVSLKIRTRKVTAIIGPSGCGKSTFIRCLNRMHEVTPGGRVEGKVLLDDEDLYGAGIDPVSVRREVGMVFQRPNPFPTMSIYDNVAAGLRLNGNYRKSELNDIVDKSLKGANL